MGQRADRWRHARSWVEREEAGFQARGNTQCAQPWETGTAFGTENALTKRLVNGRGFAYAAISCSVLETVET